MYVYYTYQRKDPRDTVQEDQITGVNNGSDIVVGYRSQREPIEGQDEHRHYANIHHISHAENQEEPHSSDEMDEAV
ncbi:hypothetical protein CRUP_037140 [Coryphaenoides rupestris]|nr:hypothetical protein CRUP_037140 [Coryphaenoides rupestris]